MSDLFTPEEELARQQAIMGFIKEFQRQLKTAKSTTERRELETAIRSYRAALEPPKPNVPRRK